MLEDAANELFLENGYAGTTIEQITSRAGVSRNTFFNYFDAKSDVFWVHIDDRIATLADALSAVHKDVPVMKAVAEGIESFGVQFGPSQVPWALTQYELIGSTAELQTSALARVPRIARILTTFLTQRLDVAASRAVTADERNRRNLLIASAANALTGAMIAGSQAWAAAGTVRGPLAPYLSAAIAPVCAGFADLLQGKRPI